MTHEQLVEKVAEAMWGERKDWNGKPVPWRTSGDVWDGDRRMTRNDARAAIAAVYEAMREPSAEMVTAARELIQYDIDPPPFSNVLDACRAAIKASPLNGEQRHDP